MKDYTNNISGDLFFCGACSVNLNKIIGRDVGTLSMLFSKIHIIHKDLNNM